MRAWQREVRDAHAGEGGPNLSPDALHSARVLPISFQAARRIILRYEWLGSMPYRPTFYLTVRTTAAHGDILVGAVVMAPPMIVGLRRKSRYAYSVRKSNVKVERGTWQPGPSRLQGPGAL